MKNHKTMIFGVKAYNNLVGETMVEEIREVLQKHMDEEYRKFNKSLIPGDGAATMLGVRLPKLREIAKKIAKENGREYLTEIEEKELQGDVYHEELLLHGCVIGYLDCETEERKERLRRFVPAIENWAVCDSSCMTYKFMKKNPEEWFPYLLEYANSNRVYEVRFAVVCLLDHFVTETYLDRVLEVLKTISVDAYYVQMAVAWAVSVCYVKFPEKTEKLLTENCLDDFTHNKSIQKIRESYRVSKEDKERLNTWKRPKKKESTLS